MPPPKVFGEARGVNQPPCSQSGSSSKSALVKGTHQGRLQTPTASIAPAAETAPRSPAVESLVGALSGKKASEADYRTYLVEKHR